MKKSTPIKNKKIVIKLGGSFIESKTQLFSFLEEFSELSKNNTCILVHGGGKTLSKYSTEHRTPQSPRFNKDGRRITSKKEMVFADRILSGQINTQLVRDCFIHGITSVGLCGADNATFVGKALPQTKHTGVVSECNLELIQYLCRKKIVPIICSVTRDTKGSALNINADDVAHSLSQKWLTDYLLLLSDVEGVFVENGLQKKLNCLQIKKYIKNKTIQGDMVVKTQNAVKTLGHIQSYKKNATIVIGRYKRAQLKTLLEGHEGTHVV